MRCARWRCAVVIVDAAEVYFLDPEVHYWGPYELRYGLTE